MVLVLGHPFGIEIDHQNLKFLLEQKITTPLQQKWLSHLLDYDYTIVYKKGVDNIAADSLSRAYKDQSTCHTVSTLEVAWL